MFSYGCKPNIMTANVKNTTKYRELCAYICLSIIPKTPNRDKTAAFLFF